MNIVGRCYVPHPDTRPGWFEIVCAACAVLLLIGLVICKGAML